MVDTIRRDEFRIPMIILPAFSRYYRELAIDPREGLAIVGDDFDISDIENQYINVVQFQALLSIFRSHTNDDAVGLSFGKSFSFDFLYDFELLLQTASGIDEVLPFVVSLINSINPISVFSCIRTETGAVAYIRDKVAGLLEESESAMIADAIFSLFQEICQRVKQSEYEVQSISFMHRISQGNIERYKDRFGVPVSPGSPVNALRFSYSKGQHNIKSRSKEFHEQVIEAVLLKLKNLQNANDFSAQVLAFIEGHEQPLELETNELASRLGV
ncbi:MAG: AraC family transcriptional regulator ligand-binding domain-containing protein, partial [Pseudomonadales bacterium]|nr:AraC family transcriptional regulator ligand-binding domain-containing protein [Pseudomonadales bacterium]